MIKLSDIKVRAQYRTWVRYRLVILEYAGERGAAAAGRHYGLSARTIRGSLDLSIHRPGRLYALPRAAALSTIAPRLEPGPSRGALAGLSVPRQATQPVSQHVGGGNVRRCVNEEKAV